MVYFSVGASAGHEYFLVIPLPAKYNNLVQWFTTPPAFQNFYLPPALPNHENHVPGHQIYFGAYTALLDLESMRMNGADLLHPVTDWMESHAPCPHWTHRLYMPRHWCPSGIIKGEVPQGQLKASDLHIYYQGVILTKYSNGFSVEVKVNPFY